MHKSAEIYPDALESDDAIFENEGEYSRACNGSDPDHRRKSTHEDPFLTIRIRVISESDLFRFAPSRVIPTSFVGMLQVIFLTDSGSMMVIRLVLVSRLVAGQLSR
jgi:hypothetical protein